MTTTKILANTLDPATAQQQILAALNSGSVLVDYSGHGSEQQWSFEDLFDNTAAAGLTNGSRLPVYVLMDCLNGFFHDVYEESLSTALMLAPNGGAVAVWASSGFTTEPPQAVMNQAFLRAVASKPSLPLGRAAMQGQEGNRGRRCPAHLDSVRRSVHVYRLPAIHRAFELVSDAPSQLAFRVARQPCLGRGRA